MAINREVSMEIININKKYYEEFMFYTSHGIELSDMQLILMFHNRQYGKTFMSMCKFMYSVKDKKEFIVTTGSNPSMGYRPFVYDEDCTNMERYVWYLRELVGFVSKYFPYYKIEKINSTTWKYIDTRKHNLFD